MKVLKISDGKCTFSIDGTSYKSICEINKQDLLKILDYIYKNDNYEIDMITSETVIYNEVEKIIYSSILLKIKDFIENEEDSIIVGNGCRIGCDNCANTLARSCEGGV